MSQRLSVSFCNHWMFVRRVVSRHHLLQKTSPEPLVRFEPNMTIFFLLKIAMPIKSLDIHNLVELPMTLV